MVHAWGRLYNIINTVKNDYKVLTKCYEVNKQGTEIRISRGCRGGQLLKIYWIGKASLRGYHTQIQTKGSRKVGRSVWGNANSEGRDSVAETSWCGPSNSQKVLVTRTQQEESGGTRETQMGCKWGPDDADPRRPGEEFGLYFKHKLRSLPGFSAS